MSPVKPATAKSYLGALRSFHIQAGIDMSGIDDSRIPLILRGGKRVYGEGEKAIRYPLTSDILLRLVNEIHNDEEGVNVKAAFCVAFAAFLRSGDITWDTWSPDSHLSHLSRKHVAFHPSSVTLSLPASKTDQFRAGTKSISHSPLFLPSVQLLHSEFYSIGAAVTADRNGISKHDIQILGRWKSDAVDVYIDERQKSEHIHKILLLNAQLLSPLIH